MTGPTAPSLPASPPPSPRAPSLPQPVLSRLLLWRARARRNLASAQQDEPEGSGTGTDASSLPKKPVKAHHIECSSGAEVITHERLVDAHPQCRKSNVIVHQDLFECLNGVDTKRLLLLARRRMFEKVELLGGNAIIDERWSCTICKHATRRGVLYRISITYQGTPARSTLPDPQRPVAMDEARGVPGLMTVVSRQWKLPSFTM